ncbi:MAG: hypothetical protein ACQGVK_23705 [Myxococcota bacterium]
MRLEFNIEIDRIEVPRFSVEATEGIGKLFTLATLVMNVLEQKQHVEIVFHGLNPEDPQRKIGAFGEILSSCESLGPVQVSEGKGGRIEGSSSYFQWVQVTR